MPNTSKRFRWNALLGDTVTPLRLSPKPFIPWRDTVDIADVDYACRDALLNDGHKKKAANPLNGLTAGTENLACHKNVTISLPTKSDAL